MRKGMIKLGATVDNAIGYCKKHRITITAHQMKVKNCLGKECRALVKYENTEYWISRNAHEAKKREQREEAKRLKKERIEREKMNQPQQQLYKKEHPDRITRTKDEENAIMKSSIADLLKARGLYIEENAIEGPENSGTNSYK